jgi:hypothetical protein
MREIGRSQKGQGTIEYILVLMITVILILSVITQFNRSFSKYASRLFDGYLACLLETGELPGRGGNCETELTYNSKESEGIVTGKSLEDWHPGEGKSTDSGGGADSKSNGSSASTGSGKDGSDSSGSSGGGGGGSSVETASSGSADSSGSQPVGFLRDRGSRRSTAVGKAESKSKDGAADSMLNVSAGAGGSGDYGSSGKKKAILRDFNYFGQEEKESREQERPKVSAVTKESEGNDALKPKKAIERERKPAATMDDNNDGFSFGYLIKILLISGIFLAIVVFFGGQILQASKSWEK